MSTTENGIGLPQSSGPERISMSSQSQAGTDQGAVPSVQPKVAQRPERALTLLSVSTGVLFAFIGSAVGALFLTQLSGLPIDAGASLFPSHPFLQIYGFIALFVMGVDYSLLPRFKVGRLPSVLLGYTAYALVTAANAFFLLYSLLSPGSFRYVTAGALLMLVGSVVFLSQVVILVTRPSGGFPEANPLIMLSSISLVMISLLLVIESAGYQLPGGAFSPQMIYLALIGFAGSMICAVEIRSVSFRQCNYRKRVAKLCGALQGLGIGAVFTGVVTRSGPLSLIGAVLLLGAALSELVSVKILELSHPLMYRPAMTKMHFRIMRYNEVCMLLASGWLVFGSLMGVVWLATGTGTFFIRDSFIHAIAIGFVGSTITCFAPMLLPGLLGHKGPVTGLSFGPIAVLNAGILVRVVGDFQTLAAQAPPLWEAASGPLILLTMGWFLIMMRGIGKPQQVAALSSASKKFSLEESRGIAEGKLTVSTRRTKREVTFPVWFVVEDGSIHLLPVNGSSTSWYRNVSENPGVKVVIAWRVYVGTAQSTREKEKVKRVMGMFRDKYGDRNCNNFFGDRADVVVSVYIPSPQPPVAPPSRVGSSPA